MPTKTPDELRKQARRKKSLARIIPAIDIINGQCVRLRQGDFQQKTVYSRNPVAVARELEAQGFCYLHLVDLDGARSGAVRNWGILEAIARETRLEIDFGGGIASAETIEEALSRGATRVNIGSAAVKQRIEFYQWLNTFGAETIILSADVRNEMVLISGWQKQSSIRLWDLLEEYQAHGGLWVTITDVARDGMLEGPALSLYRRVLKEFPELNLIASGGITRMEDVLALNRIGVWGMIIGKALYEEKLTAEMLETFLC